jgi:hypothetical protein
MMPRAIALLAAISFCLASLSCSPRGEERETGSVDFSIEGQRFHIENRELSVRANPGYFEDSQVKTIPRGTKTTIEFFLKPTLAQQTENENLIKKSAQAEGESRARLEEELIRNTFYAAWAVETDKPERFAPEAVLKTGLRGPDLRSLDIRSAGFLVAPVYEVRGCWIRADEITRSRVAGVFGGLVEISDGTTNESRKVEITEGSFDVPYRKLYRCK